MRKEIKDKIEKCLTNNIVNLANMQIEDHEILEIMQLITLWNSNISKIDLDKNNLNDDAAFILTEYLYNFPNIKELSLQCNNIGKEGALSLFSMKKELPNLNILFYGNKINKADELLKIELFATFKI